MLANAQYAAQKAHGSGDVMVNVSYMVDGKKFLAKTKVKKITVTGYPARYVDFRTPTEEDRKNVEAFYNAGKLIELLGSYCYGPAEGSQFCWEPSALIECNRLINSGV